MCGRATLISGIKEVEKLFGLSFDNDLVASWGTNFPNYNLAPTHLLPALIREEQMKVVLLKWGLSPHWAKDSRVGYKMINARAETIREKPAYKNAFQKRRCLIALDGYYEWQGKEKVPWRITSDDEKPFAIAGIWGSKSIEGGEELRTASIITRPALKELSHIHDRMPLTLLPETYDYWLNADFSEESEWKDFIYQAVLPLPKCYPVSMYVNSVKNAGEKCIIPAISDEQLSLF